MRPETKARPTSPFTSRGAITSSAPGEPSTTSPSRDSRSPDGERSLSSTGAVTEVPARTVTRSAAVTGELSFGTGRRLTETSPSTPERVPLLIV